MVKIKKGDFEAEVTRGAFEGYYKRLGYRIIDDTNKMSSDDSLTSRDGSENQPQDEREANEFSELLEKPIASWSKEEMKKFAVANDISLKGVSSVNEVREKIKKYLDI